LEYPFVRPANTFVPVLHQSMQSTCGVPRIFLSFPLSLRWDFWPLSVLFLTCFTTVFLLVQKTPPRPPLSLMTFFFPVSFVTNPLLPKGLRFIISFFSVGVFSLFTISKSFPFSFCVPRRLDFSSLVFFFPRNDSIPTPQGRACVFHFGPPPPPPPPFEVLTPSSAYQRPFVPFFALLPLLYSRRYWNLPHRFPIGYRLPSFPAHEAVTFDSHIFLLMTKPPCRICLFSLWMFLGSVSFFLVTLELGFPHFFCLVS